MTEDSLREETALWYAQHYQRKGADRDDLLRNPGVLFQSLAFEASFIRAMRSVGADPSSSRVLDVGCGMGGSIWHFLHLGFIPANIYGIDILENHVAVARSLYPFVNCLLGDARQMDFADSFFDIVAVSGMFIQITDDAIAERIAREMLRVTKPGGHIVISDWRYSWPGDRTYSAVSRKRIVRLFGVGLETSLRGIHRGALVPPLGRLLSNKLPCMYFLVAGLVPFLVGEVTTVLLKPH